MGNLYHQYPQIAFVPGLFLGRILDVAFDLHQVEQMGAGETHYFFEKMVNRVIITWFDTDQKDSFQCQQLNLLAF